MNFRAYVNLVKSDLYRYHGEVSLSKFLVDVALNVGFKYTFWMRTSLFLRGHVFLYAFYLISRLINIRYTYKYGIDVPYNTGIGPGFYIGHFGGIVVNYRSIIGANCNISPGVILGQSNRGSNKGYPIIGDNVFIGPGAKIFGKIRIGHNPDNGVVVGSHAKVISYNGSRGYINRIDYESFLSK
jgi:serine O-acetyltransferase